MAGSSLEFLGVVERDVVVVLLLLVVGGVVFVFDFFAAADDGDNVASSSTIAVANVNSLRRINMLLIWVWTMD